jgi:hypothetical protein
VDAAAAAAAGKARGLVDKSRVKAVAAKISAARELARRLASEKEAALAAATEEGAGRWAQSKQ